MNSFRRLYQLALLTLSIATSRNLDLIAAGFAFYAMFAIFPAAAAITALWGLMSDPVIVMDQVAMLEPFMPREAFAIFDEQVRTLVEGNSGALGWATVISTAVALWSTRAGVGHWCGA